MCGESRRPLILADTPERVIARLANNEYAVSRERAAEGGIFPLRSHLGCRAACNHGCKNEQREYAGRRVLAQMFHCLTSLERGPEWQMRDKFQGLDLLASIGDIVILPPPAFR